ncbi:MAG: DUF1800 domain-containing protein [Gammaproteobacteria bacterium]|nr:DUF1800 domain-containing protein [Gammaproteobacteria bacterium]MDH4315552.1 DUF1800 domain-containing protein [Gammaproteobacteria bacterium]MDH5214399.1 DUF1800 domain-containing protein [Gammaproteobacteria bacterium]
MTRHSLISTVLLLALLLSGCGGSSGSAAPPPPPPPVDVITKAEAFQFLNQATFGATEAEAQRVIDMGYAAWIDEQLQQPASLQLPFLKSLPRPMFLFELQDDRADIWFRNVVYGNDQLRQRVAFALSEVMVVSQLGALIEYTYSLADYYDMLALNAFGNYRDLIEDVTLHPAMGVYLSMLGNEKPNPALNIRPDENYARELMQLFSIGLVELNIDGSVKLDTLGQPTPTYDQSIIEGFAHVYTGWNYAGAPSFELAFPNDNNQTVPMQLYPSFHDTGSKKLLRGITLPQGQTGGQDLSGALDNIFDHPNVGPFIAIRLIQRLVTSNPSPAYVQRVASTFNDNGAGVRGDLAAVVRAILLDPEARPDIPMDLDGKLKEPLLRLTQVWRAYNATSASGRMPFAGAYIFFGQGPLQAPSVFNFFTPFYAPPGEIRDSSLVAPELQIATEFQNTLVTNYLLFQALGLTSEATGLGEDDVFINIDQEMAVAADTDALVSMVAGKLLAGQLSPTLETEVKGMINRIPDTQAAIRVGEAIYFIATSPEFAYQR